MKPTEYEIDVLKTLNGEAVPGFEGWGAAMGAALGFLKGAGLVKQNSTSVGVTHEITPSGLKALEEPDPPVIGKEE